MVVEAETSVQPASWHFREGDRIADRISAIALLGGGDRTEAWLAWHDSLYCPVVAKLVRPHLVDDDRARNSIAREGDLLGRLQHPAIVRCLGARADGARPHLILEALDGPRLSTLLRRFGPLAPEQVVPLALNIASALAYMHDTGYVHLDVKPRNLIIGAAPRLIDLGVARSLTELASLTSPIGTDAYMAPEQCAVDTLAQMGPWTDAWGLSVTLYESVMGRLPFARRTHDHHPQISSPPTPLDRRVPEPIRAIVEAGLAYEPRQRPQLSDVIEALEQAYPWARSVARRRIRRRLR